MLAATDDRAVVRIDLDDPGPDAGPDAGAGTHGRPVAHVTTVCEPALRWTPR